MRRRELIRALGWTAAWPLAAQGRQPERPRFLKVSVGDAFDEAMRVWIAKNGVTRASIAVMRDKRLVFTAGYGGREAKERVAVWSLSKAITAVCIATLVKDKKLDFKDPIGPFLRPLFTRYGEPSDKRLKLITVEQLISHRGGFPRGFSDGGKFTPGIANILRERPLSKTNVEMLIPEILKISLVREPGEAYEYSNVGYILLGQIIEALTATNYEAACAERVLAKAGISAPSLDPKWGKLTHSAGGWALSGAEYLGFARLLEKQDHGLLNASTYNWLQSTDGKWTDDRKHFAYTLGVNIHPISMTAFNIYHEGSWSWNQVTVFDGAISENRGTYFLLTSDGIAWSASYDGVSSDTNSTAIGELDKALWEAHRRATVWPDTDSFAVMNVRPIS